MNKKVLLIILDGWGIGDGSEADAIKCANTVFIKSLDANNNIGKSRLHASAEDVGLPVGQMGNSEVGHLNIGAGRIVYQDLVRINMAVEDNSISENETIKNAYQYAKDNNKPIHFLGLVSDGGVHSSTKHLMKLCDIAKNYGLKNVFIHALTDGRDTDPRSGYNFVKELDQHLKTSVGKIASICGRYYTMDRDKRWERVKEGYDLLVHGKGKVFINALDAIQDSYENDITDEFIKPSVITDLSGKPLATINGGDVVICFNFRTDRLREITMALTQTNMPEYSMQTLPLYYVTMARYDESFKNVNIIFDKDDVKDGLGETLSFYNKRQLRIAETEKYPHVTFFFSGGREEAFKGEKRIMIPSPKVATYDLKPSMSAVEVKDAVVKEIKTGDIDFICLNFANADMVGHTGVYSAIIEALETVDKCVKEVVETAITQDYSILITADHGNADYVLNEDGSPNTAHSNNPVPLYLIDNDFKSINDGRLADLAPTILKIMGLPIPEAMSGKVLV